MIVHRLVAIISLLLPLLEAQDTISCNDQTGSARREGVVTKRGTCTECNECNLGCADERECEVGCKTAGCEDMELRCPKDGDCRLRCTEKNSCKDATITCPESGMCSVICTGVDSCSGLVVQQVNATTGGNVQLQCSKGSCPNATVLCPAAATCVMECNEDEACADATFIGGSTGAIQLSCSGISSCQSSKLSCPTAASGLACDVTCAKRDACKEMNVSSAVGSTGDLRLKCLNGDGACSSAAVTCPEEGNCMMECANRGICTNSIFECPVYGDCTAQCHFDSSCKSVSVLHTRGSSSGDTALECGRSACNETTLVCGNGGKCSRKCTDVDACIDSTVTCSDSFIDSCLVECFSENSCSRSNIACAQQYYDPASCELICKHDKACVDVASSGDLRKSCEPACTPTDATNIWSPAPGPPTIPPATQAPATGAPPTKPPATQAPATFPPTRAPPTNSPASQAPATFPPTQAPPTNSPATQAPATGAPPTIPPATQAPATFPPTRAPPTNSPATQAPATFPPTQAPPTNSPATQAPATGAPPTKPPATQAPATFPPTQAPPTSSPATQAPATEAPPTISPATQAPATSSPTQAPPTSPPSTESPTQIPSTEPPAKTVPAETVPPSSEAPSTGTPPDESPLHPETEEPPSVNVSESQPAKHSPSVMLESDKETINFANSMSSVAAVSIAAVSIGAVSTGPAAAKLIIVKDFGCSVDDVDLEEAEELEWEIHPTRVGFGSGSRTYFMGALVMNPLVLAAGVVLLAVAADVTQRVLNVEWLRACALVRLPGVLYVPFLFLYQGTSLVSARLAFHPEETVEMTPFAVFMLSICILTPLFIYYFVLRKVTVLALCVADPSVGESGQHRQPRPAKDDEGHDRPALPRRTALQAAQAFVMGDRMWVSTTEDTHFADRYGAFFGALRRERIWFPVVEMWSMVGLSLLSAWPTDTTVSCNARNVLVCLLFLAFLAVLIVYRPYIAAFENIAAAVMSATTLIALVLMTLGIAVEAADESGYFVAASYFLLATTLLVLCKAVWDLVAVTYSIVVDCRSDYRRQREDKKQPLIINRPVPSASTLTDADFGSVNRFAETEAFGASHVSRADGLDATLCSSQVPTPVGLVSPTSLFSGGGSFSEMKTLSTFDGLTRTYSRMAMTAASRPPTSPGAAGKLKKSISTYSG
ncbi:Circumsporozoite protein [Diplonema papillatum]|nr:Circumsporozoite protein [Diplonema papillatum]